jgi:hypothetical protein
MHDQIKDPRPSRLARVESLGRVSRRRTPNASGRARSPSGRPICPPRPRWAATASVLLTPNGELTERDRHVKQRWQALIVEARGLGELAAEHVH